MYLSMIIILTDFHLLLAESILRTGELPTVNMIIIDRYIVLYLNYNLINQIS
jgi:hypothetical protein